MSRSPDERAAADVAGAGADGVFEVLGDDGNLVLGYLKQGAGGAPIG